MTVYEEGSERSSADLPRPSAVTLVLIPLLLVCIWIIENHLLTGGALVSGKISLLGLSLYTLLSCVLVGIIVPLIRIRAAFRAGFVNMFQIGFRTLRRTVAAVSLTVLAVYTIALFLRIYGTGPDRDTGFFLAVMLLPTAIAAVMICWGLLGTHIQAYVRSGGILISVITGVVVTALVFALSITLLLASTRVAEAFPGYFAAGIVVALFFFAVRDIYATVVAVTGALVVLAGSAPGFTSPYLLVPAAAVCAFLTLAVLVTAHGHFSRHYTTVKLPEKQ
ncbi:MAG: hypothetical protein WC367_06805 [Methanoregula sp.]|jgi:hypothetical protein